MCGRGATKSAAKRKPFRLCVCKGTSLELNGIFPKWEFNDKIFVVTVKGLEPDTSCVREQDVTAVPVRHL